MMKKAALVFGCIAAATISPQLLDAIPHVQVAGSAYAAENINFKHTINLAGDQRTLTQRMSKELLLVALGYNKRENLRNLRFNHDKFERVLKALRFGDAELALATTDNPEVLTNLSRVEEIWPLFNAALQEGMASGEIDRDTVGLVSDLSLPLLSAMNDTVKSYENEASTGALFSMADIAINLADRQAMLTQKMAKEFLLIAIGEDVKGNRRQLQNSISLFETNLQGLIAGDSELRLIPAPSAQIQAQLKSVNRLWVEFKPVLETALTAEIVDEDDLADVASLNLALLAEMAAAVGMYESL